MLISLGNGDGTFQEPVSYAVGIYAEYLVMGDYNGDGDLDVIIANDDYDSTNPQLKNMSVLLGNGDGTFKEPLTTASGSLLTNLGTGDFNGDGRLDLALNGDSVMLGNGDGTFQQPISYVGGSFEEHESSVVGDFNGDGHLDLASPDLYSNVVSVLLGKGDGTFQSETKHAVGLLPWSVTPGDFNGDGLVDLVTTNSGSNDVTVLLANGDGTFVDPGQLATVPHATPLVANLRGNGTEDVLEVDADGDILDRPGQPGRPGSFDPPVTINPGDPSRDIALLHESGQSFVIASVDAHDEAVSLYAFHDGAFIRLGRSRPDACRYRSPRPT